VFIDVNLGDSKPRITLFEGDDPHEVAARFAAEHEFDKEMEKRLVMMLQAQLRTVLTSIVEGEDDEDYSDREEDY